MAAAPVPEPLAPELHYLNELSFLPVPHFIPDSFLVPGATPEFMPVPHLPLQADFDFASDLLSGHDHDTPGFLPYLPMAPSDAASAQQVGEPPVHIEHPGSMLKDFDFEHATTPLAPETTDEVTDLDAIRPPLQDSPVTIPAPIPAPTPAPTPAPVSTPDPHPEAAVAKPVKRPRQ